MPTARAPKGAFAAAMAMLPSPAPRVEHEVLRRHLRHREHGEDDGVVRRHPDDVLPGASPQGRVRGFAVGTRARLRLPGGLGEEEHGHSGRQVVLQHPGPV